MSSSSFASGTPLGSSSSPRDGNNNFPNGAENMLKLALKKPKAWKWELTTSSSSPGIDFPKIQLFDSRTGELMIQVDKPDCVVKSEQLENGSSERSRSSQSEKKGKDQRYRRSRSSCIREKVATSGEYLSDVFEQLQNKGLGYKLATSASQYRVQEEEEEDRSLQKSKSANEVNGVKKKIRKSTSSRSSSILGKISEFYKSSTEEEPVVVSPPPPPRAPPTPPLVIPEITIVGEPPAPTPAPEPPKNKIYKLVRSNVGTLIVREESFHTQRSLRRRKLESENSIPEDEPHTEQRITLPTDIPTPSYDSTINEIDKLISKVMLSHTLQSVEEPPKHSSPVRIKHESGKKRRSRRSASAGSAASRSASAGSRRSRNSPRVTVLPGSSSSEEDSVSLAESRFGSLKRRGRPKYRRHATPVATVPAEKDAVERSREQETNAARSTSLRIEECTSTLSKSSSSGTSRSRSKSSSTSVSTLSPPSEAGETSTLQNHNSSGNSETHQASIATLPEVHYERLNSIEQTAQVTEILNPRGNPECSTAPTKEPPRPKPEISSPTTPRRSKLHPETFFNSYLAELRSLSQSAQTSATSSISQPRNHLATSQSASSLVQPVKQKQYGRRHHRSSYLQVLP